MNLINILMKKASKFSLPFIERRFKSDGGFGPLPPMEEFTVTFSAGIIPVTEIPDTVPGGSNFSAIIIIPHNSMLTAKCGDSNMAQTFMSASPDGDKYRVVQYFVNGNISMTYTDK